MKHFLSNWRWRMLREEWVIVLAMVTIVLLHALVAFAQFKAADSAHNNNVAANTATTARVLEHHRSNMRILFR